MLIRKALVVAALAIAAIGFAGTASYATIPGDGGAPCNPSAIQVSDSHKVSKKDILNGKLAVGVSVTVSNSGSCGIQAYAHCAPWIGSTYYVTGGAVSTGQASVTWCHWDDGLYGNSGYQYYDGTSWHRVPVSNLHS